MYRRMDRTLKKIINLFVILTKYHTSNNQQVSIWKKKHIMVYVSVFKWHFSEKQQLFLVTASVPQLHPKMEFFSSIVHSQHHPQMLNKGVKLALKL